MIKKNKKLVWLASYPKSGNTWVRFFLANYLSLENKPVDINEIAISPIYSSRRIFDELSPVFSSDLAEDEIDILRVDVYSEIATEVKDLRFVKIHDAFYYLKNGKENIPLDSTFGVVHIIRNPLDVAVSYAFHSGIDFEKSTKIICENSTLASNHQRLDYQLRQKLLSWSGHTKSWEKCNKTRKLLIRYEDLINDKNYIFEELIRFLKIPFDKEKLLTAIKFSDFDELKKQEQEKTFKEKPFNSKEFFREGKIGDYKKLLSPELQQTIIEKNYIYMKKYNYI